jgi:hypothetical protein
MQTERFVTDLCTLRHSVLCKLTGEDKTNGGLNLTRRDSGLLVVGSKFGSLGCNALENV